MNMTNPKKYWFPAKRFGWGWSLPITWQGWLVFLVYIALITAALIFKLEEKLLLYFFIVIITVMLIAVCWVKGEPPKWRWGKK
jgi:uncharacterized membrane protein YhaH (DUF805 family)